MWLPCELHGDARARATIGLCFATRRVNARSASLYCGLSAAVLYQPSLVHLPAPLSLQSRYRLQCSTRSLPSRIRLEETKHFAPAPGRTHSKIAGRVFGWIYSSLALFIGGKGRVQISFERHTLSSRSVGPHNMCFVVRGEVNATHFQFHEKIMHARAPQIIFVKTTYYRSQRVRMATTRRS